MGRSCIEVRTKEHEYLLDCGIKFTSKGFDYPQKLSESAKTVDGIFITHAHIDHSGALPMIEHLGIDCPVFLTHQTLAITRLMLRDSFKIARIKHLHPAYTKTDIHRVRKSAKRVKPDKWYRYRDLLFRFVNAGHIPGSCSILLDADGKRILYTGDFNTRTTQLMRPADYATLIKEVGPIDCMITESTYGCRTLPQREHLQQEFLADLRRVIRNGGSVLIPVFAVGRAQEILILLSREEWGCPIYFDGMCKEITRKILLHQSTYVSNKDLLNEMYMKRVQLVGSENRRQRAAEHQPAIFISTSGMMQGGPAIHYLRHIWHDERNAVFLTGYQVHGTNGYNLITHGYAHLDDWKTYVRCQVKKYDFSGHADIDDIKKAIHTVNPRKLIIQHGDPESVEAMLSWAKQEGIDAEGPSVGDTITL